MLSALIVLNVVCSYCVECCLLLLCWTLLLLCWTLS